MNDAIAMTLYVDASGVTRCVYGESIDLHAMGIPHVERASHVEPDGDGGWSADLGPVGGGRIGPFPLRSHALAAERRWLDEHWPVPRLAFNPKGERKPMRFIFIIVLFLVVVLMFIGCLDQYSVSRGAAADRPVVPNSRKVVSPVEAAPQDIVAAVRPGLRTGRGLDACPTSLCAINAVFRRT